jgi:uncharacterized protein (TIGR02598 family)
MNPSKQESSSAPMPGHALSGVNGQDRAFSLIEIAIALGIVAFALIPVLGVMPIGLTTLRDTVDTQVTAQIAQTIVNQAEQADYNSLASTTTPYYFDEQGDLLNNSTNALYSAQLAVNEPTSIPGSLATSSSNLATLTITVQCTTTKATRIQSALVARATH